MTIIISILFLVLIAIVIWQMVRVYEITNEITGTSEIASKKDNNIQGFLMMGFLLFLYVTAFGTLWLWGDLVLPPSASVHGENIDILLSITFVVIFIVFVITQFLLHYFAMKYRGNIDRKALHYADNHTLELIWTGLPVVVLAGLIIYGLFSWTQIMNIPHDEKPLQIEVYGKQFVWEARYGGLDNQLGNANVRFIEGINTIGVDMNDANSADDIPVSELYLPKGKKVVFKFRSQDVIHSAYLPHFRVQMNCVPGMTTQFAFTPKITTAELREQKDIQRRVKKINDIRNKKNEELVQRGEEKLEPWEYDFLILCNKICGASHYNMQMKVTVVEENEFNSWLKQQKTYAELIAN